MRHGSLDVPFMMGEAMDVLRIVVAARSAGRDDAILCGDPPAWEGWARTRVERRGRCATGRHLAFRLETCRGLWKAGGPG